MDNSGSLKHYSSRHRILLVGEGDFSFALCLAHSFGSGSGSSIVATSLDSYDTLISKYKRVKSNLKNLEKLGAAILHKIDATKMKFHTDLRMQKFDRIIFNFPHAGFHGKEDQPHLIKMHRNLVQGFFKNARDMLRPYGEIHVSHKTTGPFLHWNLKELASRHSLVLIECVEFKIDDYPGYKNKKGDGPRCDEPFRLGKCSTFKFVVSCHRWTESVMGQVYNCNGLPQIQVIPLQNPHSALQLLRTDFISNMQTGYMGAQLIRGMGNEFERIFDGYLADVKTMFGRTDYDYARVARENVWVGFGKYMSGAPGGTVNDFTPYLEALHNCSKLRLAWLERWERLKLSSQP
ncbi:hypothetical protein NE237_033262 [Protea cynaroides]|uniref:25S rRNA (uridine-N(3))-methyltransferase BMT5-like domain-containing protein n=1 Tax=Protea cynaroides TaxID=273540 RepID=A0A9Q0R4N2_9MAGN|nr:hypothetical protein NE237_033262 [Protea cynaroides]